MKTYAIALSALLAFAGASVAADSTVTTTKTVKATTKTVKTPVAKTLKVKGEVVSVDAVANTLTVKGHKGSETFAVSSTAKIMTGKKETKLADIATGALVSVSYVKDGATMTASSVQVVPAKKAKAIKAAKASKAKAKADSAAAAK